MIALNFVSWECIPSYHIILVSHYYLTVSVCLLQKDTSSFESNRIPCKDCRQKKRTEKAKESKVDITSIPKPSHCVACGKSHPEVDFTFRSDLVRGGWRNECIQCYNKKGYSAKSRAIRRTNDEVAYLAHNAATHKDWVRRNPDKVLEQKVKGVTDSSRKIKVVKTSAAARGIAFDDTEAELMAAKLKQNCHYCEYDPREDGLLNGLDRLDSNYGYNDVNTVACCATCNAMKGPRLLDAFVANVRDIFAYRKLSFDEVARIPIKPFAGRRDLRDAPPKEKVDLLNDDAKVALWSSQCYLCGRSPALGIDREDSSGDYTDTNSRPCCSECNYAKKDLSLPDFERHVSFVHRHTSRWALRDVEDMPHVTLGGKEKKPVKATLVDGSSIIFPSIASAVKIIGANMSAVQKAIDNTSASCMGCKWSTVDAKEFMGQSVPRSEAFLLIRLMRASGRRNLKK
jgi:hypothetical protein